tara:strand:+ start:152 stop:889 length:738 start_codon:yes stop_codon:yes gene_type:complete
MAKSLSKTGITTGNTVKAGHITQSIDAFAGTEAYDVVLSGSLNVTGSITGEPSIINLLTSSYSMNVLSSSYSTTALSSSYSTIALSSSHSTTASYALNAGESNTSKLHLTFTDPNGGSYASGRTLIMGNGSLSRVAGTPTPANTENYFQVPVTGTIVSSSIAFQANASSVTDGPVAISLFNLDSNVSESIINSITLFGASTSSMVAANLSVTAGDRIAMIVTIGTLAGSVGSDGRINGTALLVES